MIDKPNMVENTEVVKKSKYLGVTITDNKECFNQHKKNMMEKAKKKKKWQTKHMQ